MDIFEVILKAAFCLLAVSVIGSFSALVIVCVGMAIRSFIK